MNLKELCKMKNTISRSCSMENPTGEKNKGNMALDGANAKFSYAAGLGQGWKISPCVFIKAHTTHVLADIKGMGHITHIWMTTDNNFYDTLKFKCSFDDKGQTVNCPLGAFFLNGWKRRNRVTSLAICVNPNGGLNCYLPMPFRKNALIEVENTSDVDVVLYYQVDFNLEEVSNEEMYFHAEYRHVEKQPKHEFFELVDIAGEGVYVGTYFGFKTDSTRWWGEGEFLFYLDDDEHPSIATTGTEDYFGGAWNFEQPQGHYQVFSSPYTGLVESYPEETIGELGMEFGMYRFHIVDPIYFHKNLKVQTQAIGWEEDYQTYANLSPELISVAYWYQK